AGGRRTGRRGQHHRPRRRHNQGHRVRTDARHHARERLPGQHHWRSAMSLDFRPAGRAAPRAQQVLAHARTEASLIIRNGEQALLALVIPISILVAGRWFEGRLGVDFATTVPSVLALAIWSSCFTSLAISTG